MTIMLKVFVLYIVLIRFVLPLPTTDDPKIITSPTIQETKTAVEYNEPKTSLWNEIKTNNSAIGFPIHLDDDKAKNKDLGEKKHNAILDYIKQKLKTYVFFNTSKENKNVANELDINDDVDDTSFRDFIEHGRANYEEYMLHKFERFVLNNAYKVFTTLTNSCIFQPATEFNAEDFSYRHLGVACQLGVDLHYRERKDNFIEWFMKWDTFVLLKMSLLSYQIQILDGIREFCYKLKKFFFYATHFFSNDHLKYVHIDDIHEEDKLFEMQAEKQKEIEVAKFKLRLKENLKRKIKKSYLKLKKALTYPKPDPYFEDMNIMSNDDNIFQDKKSNEYTHHYKKFNKWKSYHTEKIKEITEDKYKPKGAIKEFFFNLKNAVSLLGNIITTTGENINEEKPKYEKEENIRNIIQKNNFRVRNILSIIKTTPTTEFTDIMKKGNFQDENVNEKQLTVQKLIEIVKSYYKKKDKIRKNIFNSTDILSYFGAVAKKFNDLIVDMQHIIETKYKNYEGLIRKIFSLRSIHNFLKKVNYILSLIIK